MTVKPLIFNTNKVIYNVLVLEGNTKTTISSAGNLKHADTTDNTGIPVFDNEPFTGDYTSCYVHILDFNTNNNLTVVSGSKHDEKIFGITNGGASTSPNEVEILFYSVPFGSDINSSTISPYIWETKQVSFVNFGYGYCDRLEQINHNSMRLGSSTSYNTNIQKIILANDGTLVYVGDGVILTKL